MFQLDDKFLEDVGLNDLPEEQKKPFLDHIYEQLEQRVGVKLSEGLSDEQLEQFEKITDQDERTVEAWLEQYAPQYQEDGVFVQMQQATQLDSTDSRLKAEYAATKWLEVNRPDYRQVVAQVLGELKKEISGNASKILEN